MEENKILNESKKVSYGIVYILHDDNDERGEMFDTEEEAKDFAKSIDKEKFNGYRIMKIESHEEDGEEIFDDEIVVDSEAFDEVEESLTEAEEDEMSDDELDALDAEEEKAFKQKQADRRARIAGKRAEKSEKDAKIAELKSKLGNEYDFDRLFDVLVPDTGSADTVAGEVIRALNKVDFRDFNDGEVFYEGDGLDSAGASMAFVAEFFLDRFNDSDDTDTVAEDIYNEIINIAEDQLTDSAYRTQLYDLEKQVVAWIKAHEDILVEPNEKDSLHQYRGEDYWADYIPTYDIEDIELPRNVKELMELGVIDGDDVVWAVQDIIQGMGNSTNDVRDEGEYISVYGLSKADFDACGGEQGADLYDWIEEWAMNEYDDPDEIRARQEEEERAEAEEEESEEETDEGLEEATGYDHYGAKEMKPFKGPAYIQYDGGPRQIDVLTRARNHKWVWKNKAGISDDEWYIFPSFEDALKVQKEVGGEIMSWNQYAGVKDEPEEDEEETDESLNESMKSEVTKWWEDVEDANLAMKWGFRIDNEGCDVEAMHAAMFDMLDELEEKGAFELFERGKKIYNKYAKYSKYNPGKLLTPKEGLEEELEAGDCVYHPERDEYYYLKKTDKPNKFELFTHSDSRGFEVASPRFIDKNSPFYNKLKLHTKNANPEFKECIDTDKSKEYNELHEDTEMNLWQKLEPLYNEGKVYFDVVEKQEGGEFLIIEDWESLIAIEKALQPGFEPKDNYDTSVLDELNIDYGFSDEWGRCDTCGKLIRLEADSAHWVPDFFWDEDGIECGNCVRKNPEGYIYWLLEEPSKRANTILDGKALEAAGFHRVEGDYEDGWYDRHDSPEEILAKAQEEHPEAEFIFSISGVGKFAVQFELWMRGE